MTRIEKYSRFCKSFEGGWANDPDDAGGATMKGVTYKRFCEYRRVKKLPIPTLTDLRNISDKEWEAVLRWGFWDVVKADQIKDEWCAYMIVDWCWHGGLGKIKNIQRLIGVKDDGKIGPITLAKLNSYTGKALFDILWKGRENNLKYVATLRNNKKYLNGWLRRLRCIQYGKLITNGGATIQ